MGGTLVNYELLMLITTSNHIKTVEDHQWIYFVYSLSWLKGIMFPGLLGLRGICFSGEGRGGIMRNFSSATKDQDVLEIHLVNLSPCQTQTSKRYKGGIDRKFGHSHPFSSSFNIQDGCFCFNHFRNCRFYGCLVIAYGCLW